MQSNPEGALAAQPTQTPPTLLEIRPDAATFWRGVGFRALIFLPLIALAIYRSAGRHPVAWSVLLYGALAVVLVVGALVMLQTSSIILTATTVEKRRRWWPPTIVQRAAVASAVLVPLYRSAFNRTAALLVLVGGSGRPVLRLTGQVFADSDLFALAERFGHSLEVIEGVTGPKAVARRHRRLLPLVERHPALVIAGGTVVLLIAVVVGVTIFAPVN